MLIFCIRSKGTVSYNTSKYFLFPHFKDGNFSFERPTMLWKAEKIGSRPQTVTA